MEEQYASLQKEASDLRTSLRDVEKARLESRREAQDLHRQLKQLNGACSKVLQLFMFMMQYIILCKWFTKKTTCVFMHLIPGKHFLTSEIYRYFLLLVVDR